MELLTRLRDEVPRDLDVRAEEARLRSAMTAAAGGGARRLPRWRLGVALVGAFGLAVAGFAVLHDDEPAAKPPPLTAAAVLEDAALVAEKSDMPDIRPDQWIYMKEGQPIPELPVYESWTRMDGKLAATRKPGGKIKISKAEKGPANPGKTQAELESLPDDPDRLLAHIRTLAPRAGSICQPNCPPGTEDDVNAFGTIQWYLKFGPIIPPQKAAAMFRALGRIPNVRIEENVDAGFGRKGLGVVLDLGEAGKGYTILDPVDYDYLGWKAVRDGTEFAMPVLATALVDEAGQVP
ncbi:CU044_5270 family protein [Nonomuraea sp. NPDC049725]|uniref:CU044_5270 family protein n=1 Tax=Nonomuraea sp. NPDC049725 TaxID=3154508 RepID=UPI0034386D5E